MGIEKIGSLIERFKELAVLLFQNGLQLIDISHEEHLLASKRLAHLMTVDAQDLVDEVDNIGSHHRHLVNDYQLHLAQELDLFAIIAQRLADIACRITGVGRQQRMEGEFEEGMERSASSIDGSNARRRKDDMLLLGRSSNIAEEGRFACPRLARQEERVMRELDNLECLLQLLIVQIHFFYSRSSHVLSLPIL